VFGVTFTRTYKPKRIANEETIADMLNLMQENETSKIKKKEHK
jgi:hypothetical protein